VGRNLVPHLAEEHEIFGVVRSRKAGPEMSKVAAWLAWDLARPPTLASLPTQLDAIIHLAFSDQAFPEHATEVFATNVAATQFLADLASRSGVRDFIFASTGNVYTPSLDPLSEDDRTEPADYYGFSKLASEKMLLQYTDYFGVKILRLFTPYGPGQKDRMIPKIIAQVRAQQPVILTNEGQPWISPIYIDDLVRIVSQSLSHRHNYIVNIGGEGGLSVKRIAQIAGEAIGRTPRFENKQEIGGRNFIAKIDLMKSLFALPKIITPAEGIQRVIQSPV
jgi:nucleoside-diphosphate-sugar epimerase